MESEFPEVTGTVRGREEREHGTVSFEHLDLSHSL